MRLLDVLTSPWAIIPAKLDELTEIYSAHLRREKIDFAAVEARIGKPLVNEAAGYRVVDGVALLPVEGVLAKKANLLMQVSGAMSMQMIGAEFAKALDDPAVSSVVLVVDSPGGTVDGTQELARAVFNARGGGKPVVAWVDGMMASAAYWVGSAADAVFVGANTDMVGSIGVAMQHIDRSAMDKQAGIVRTDIYAGKYKRIATDNGPLTEAGQAYLQDQVDSFYSVFVDAVAQQRGVGVDAVLKNMAEGRIFLGRQAIDAGLVDGASTLPDLIAELAGGGYQRRRMGVAGALAPALLGQAPAANGSTPTGAGAAPEAATHDPNFTDPKGTPMKLTREQFAAEHPELLAAIIAEGAAIGAAAELARIQAVQAVSMPGHEKLVAALAFDGKTTGPEAAAQVIAAEKSMLARQKAAITEDRPAPAPAAPSATGATGEDDITAAEAGLPVDERCKARWDRDAAIRAEFGTLAGYTAYSKAAESGKVRVLGTKRAA